MVLEIGSANADSGMSQAIYQEMDRLLSPLFQDVDQETLDAARKGWKKLSFAIASGVISHILSNMEIIDIHASGTIDSQMVNTVQTDDGTGHVA